MIRLARPEIDDADISAVVEVLRGGQLVQGEQVRRFEDMIAVRLRATNIAAVSNGTAALHLALLALRVGPGDRVAVPTFSWPATANAVLLCGATPLFVDIEGSTLGMDPMRLADLLARDGRVKVILPVHAFGRMAQIDELSRVALAYDIPIVEDAACALGAELSGRPAGTWGVLGTFSFHPRKAATTGEGGAIACQRSADLHTIRALRNHGLDPDALRPDFITAGFNYRLTEFQAALGQSQLARYDSLLAARRALARRYDTLLTGLPLATPDAGASGAHVYQSYVVLLEPAVASHRDSLIQRLRERGVETTIGTYHMPLLSHLRKVTGHKPGDHPVGESIARRALALPLHPGLSVDDQIFVVDALGEELAMLN